MNDLQLTLADVARLYGPRLWLPGHSPAAVSAVHVPSEAIPAPAPAALPPELPTPVAPGSKPAAYRGGLHTVRPGAGTWRLVVTALDYAEEPHRALLNDILTKGMGIHPQAAELIVTTRPLQAEDLPQPPTHTLLFGIGWQGQLPQGHYLLPSLGAQVADRQAKLAAWAVIKPLIQA